MSVSAIGRVAASGARPVSGQSPAPEAPGSTAGRQSLSFAAQLAKYRLGALTAGRRPIQPSLDPALAASLSKTTPSPDPSPSSRPASSSAGANAAERMLGVSAPERTPWASRPDGPSQPMALAEFPRPDGDNGRGMHWVPICQSSNEVVDRYVDEAVKMGVKWMVFLNEGTRIGDNDYLVDRLVDNGIMPIMRVYTPNGRDIEGDLEALVKHYRQRGVEYFQLYNEPNLNVENPDGVPNVDRYVDQWIAGARSVVAAGGLPGFGSLAPGGNFDDLEFLRRALDAVKARGETRLLDRAWLSMHNYTFNHPLDYAKDSNGYMKFKWYDAIIREKLGRSMPIIGTEGGTFVGASEDKTFPAVSTDKQIEMVVGAYDYVKQRREPYYFAYSYWVIANEAGGGHDLGFSNHALFRPNGPTPVVEALRRTARTASA